jgi:3-hydroxyisobutyrate dehydrogenase
VGEAIAMSEAFGLDPGFFLEAIKGGPLDTPYVKIKSDAILKRELSPSFKAATAAKDAGLVVSAARSAGANPKVAEAVREQLQRTVDLGHGDEDMAAVYFAARQA